ncbi:hypothetical protein D3C76_670820 [compost metagenome]
MKLYWAIGPLITSRPPVPVPSAMVKLYGAATFTMIPVGQSAGNVPAPLGSVTVSPLKFITEAVTREVKALPVVSSRPDAPVLLAPTSGAVYQKKWAWLADKSAPGPYTVNKASLPNEVSGVSPVLISLAFIW